MLKKNKIFKNFYTFATFSLIGTSAIYAKDGSSIPNDTLIENQQKLKNRATMSTKVSNKIKNKLDSDLDLDFDFDEQRKSEDSIVKDIKDKAPYIAMATAPSLTVLSYGAIRKVFVKVKSKKLDDNNNNNKKKKKKKNKNNNNNNNNNNNKKKKKKKKKNKNNNNNNNNNNENEESSSALTILATVLVAIVFLLIIYDKCCGSSDNVPPKAKEVPIDIKRIPNQEEKGNQIQENKVKQFYGNSEELNKYKNRNSSPKDYIEDVYKKTGVGALEWENNNCFILSGIYTQFCISLKTMNGEIDDIVNIANTGKLNIKEKEEAEKNKIRIFISILEKRLKERSEKEPNRFIWKQCKLDLEELKKSENKDKLKNFVTCALNVILMNRLSWDGFMQVPNEQYKQENNLFGLKTTIDRKNSHYFRKNNDQGSPADALGGMGIRLTDVGATAFDYYIVKGRNEKIPVSPENNFPYRQVLDLTSEFVTMQYDKNEGFKIIDRTWSKGEGVTIKLGGNFDNGPISYENAAIAKLWTVNSTDGQNNYYDDEKSFIDENKKEQVEANAKKYLHKLESSRELVGKGKIVEMYEYVINEDIYGKERRFGTEALCKDALEKKRNLNGKETYEKKLKNFTIEYNEKVDNIIPEDFQKKRMYIGAIGYVKGGAAGNGGHCQTLEPKYKWNDKKGYYEIVCWIDRGCLGGAGKVISNDEALSILKEHLGKYNGNKDNTRAGACRLITEQVIDDCPEQYCFNNDKAEHTEERKKQLEGKRNKGNYKTVQEINSVEDILKDISKNKKDNINLSSNNNNNIISNNINNIINNN